MLTQKRTFIMNPISDASEPLQITKQKREAYISNSAVRWLGCLITALPPIVDGHKLYPPTIAMINGT